MTDEILKIKNVTKSFGDFQVHKGINLELRKNETLGLLGGSGTGKSVLLREIIGLETIDDGEIYFKDQRIDTLDEKEIIPYRLKISFSFQNGALFDSLSVFDNLAIPLQEHTDLSPQEISQRVSETLKIFDLEGKEDVMPSDLSGGMQKRIGMARSIILNPDIILYDEPTAGLDPTNIDNVLSVMEKLKRDKNISSIFVTHDIPAVLKISDRIALLYKGRIEFVGTPKEILTTDNKAVRDFIDISLKQVDMAYEATRR